MSYTPPYSHGGPDAAGWPAVPGNIAGAGRPISIIGCVPTFPVAPAMLIIYTGTTGQTATVILECNGGPLDLDGKPPSTDWIDVSAGGYVLTIGAANATQFEAKVLAPTVPFWRTRIVAGITGGHVSSYIPLMPTKGGILVNPSYPTLISSQSLF